ncbi:MAG: hypothetical protein GWN73_43355, partial [Actinobacteria bacterium]|nr:hypothetical protein [Actinomycetota bacterium]NIS37415.1 hypothetical protein [Actinomycetota bacterium]NIU71842.1 hypothetical protein [Actinomycetota bacterium]NIW33788.1 hypothetical protein [Actinomycetota bacterium]
EVALLIDGAVLGRWPFAVAAPEWTLDLRPTGEVLVFNGDAALLREGYAPPGAATAVVYGRNINRAE